MAIAFAEHGSSSLSYEIRNKRRMAQSKMEEKDYWPMYGSPIKSYDESFKASLNAGSLINFLKDRPDPVVIDLMAPTDTIIDLFEHLPRGPKMGIAVSLVDRRKRSRIKHETSMGITQISGDITE